MPVSALNSSTAVGLFHAYAEKPPLSCLLTQSSHESLDVLHERWAVKIDGPEAVCHNRSLAIDHVCGWHVPHPEFAGHFHPCVHRRDKGIAAFGDKSLHRLLSTAV